MKPIALIICLFCFVLVSKAQEYPTYPEEGGFFPEYKAADIKSFRVYNVSSYYGGADTILRKEIFFDEQGYMTLVKHHESVFQTTFYQFTYNDAGFMTAIDTTKELNIRGPIANPAPGVLDGVYIRPYEFTIEEKWVSTPKGTVLEKRVTTYSSGSIYEEYFKYDQENRIIEHHSIHIYENGMTNYTMKFTYTDDGFLKSKAYGDNKKIHFDTEFFIVYDYWE